ncbi:MAG: sugar transferase [Terriglobales bacterium]
MSASATAARSEAAPAVATTAPHPPRTQATLAGLRRLLTMVSLDAGLLLAGFALACLARLALAREIGRFQVLPHAPTQYAICGAIALAMLLYEGVYTGGLAHLDQTELLVKALTGGLAAMIVYSFAMHNSYLVSRLVLVLGYLADLLLFTLVRPILRRYCAGPGPELTLIIGDPRASGAEQALRHAGLRVRVLGAEQAANISSGVFLTTVGDGLEADFSSWEQRLGEVGLVLAGPNTGALGARPLNLRGIQLYCISHPLSRRFNRAMKRAADFAGAAVLLLLSSPLLALAWLAVRWDSPGSAFFAQQRIGRHGRPFRVWKFRTMHADADRRLEMLLAANPALAAEYRQNYKLKNDPRVTRTGRLLRRTSLDELPQLWNVLRGDMSLVGPRPIIASEVELYGPDFRVVTTVRPGLTGIWQTTGRSTTSYDARRQFDLYYVRRWSPWLDLAVLIRTLQAMILPADF